MKVNSDFECGNGKQFTEVSPLRWRMQVCADQPGYDHYFCVRIESEQERGTAELEIFPDSDVPVVIEEAGAPGLLWRRLGNDGAWERVRPGTFIAGGGRLLVRQPVEPGQVWYLSEACPLPSSDIARHIQELPTHCRHARAVPLGDTPEGRPLRLTRLTDPHVPDAEKGRVFVLGGQHGAEFAGSFAVKGVLDFLASALPQAAALRRRYVFDVLPCANPDGNAHGRGCFNAERRDQFEAFANVAAGAAPATAEAGLIWNHLAANPPDLLLNFHAYPHPRAFGDPPYEGVYVTTPELLTTPARRAHQQALNHALFYLTDGGSQHRRPCPGRTATLEMSAALAWNSLTALYQVQAEQGPHANLLTGIRVLNTVLETLELAQEEEEEL